MYKTIAPSPGGKNMGGVCIVLCTRRYMTQFLESGEHMQAHTCFLGLTALCGVIAILVHDLTQNCHRNITKVHITLTCLYEAINSCKSHTGCNC